MKRFLTARSLPWVLGTAMFAAVPAGGASPLLRDGLHAGYSFGGDINQENPAIGYQVIWQLGEYVSLEASLTRQTDELKGRTGSFDLPQGVSIDMDLYAACISAHLEIHPLETLSLYALGGVGYYFFKTDAQATRVYLAEHNPDTPDAPHVLNTNVDVEDDFGFHIGLGIEWHFDEHWSIFADYRRVFLETDATLESTVQLPPAESDQPPTRHDTRVPGTFSYDHNLVRMGLSYQF